MTDAKKGGQRAVVKRAFQLFGKGRERGEIIRSDELDKLSVRHRVALESAGLLEYEKLPADYLDKPVAVAQRALTEPKKAKA